MNTEQQAAFEKMVDAFCSAWGVSFNIENPFFGMSFDEDDRRHIAAGLQAAMRQAVPDTVPAAAFDGYAVYQALSEKARNRTSADNVADVLDALAKVMREAGQVKEPTA